MNYLLDTHIIIEGMEKKLPKKYINILKKADDEKDRLFASIASPWEIAIKMSNGKLEFNGGLNAVYDFIDKSNIQLLPIKREYTEVVKSLPFFHRDPFDRIIISTALCESMTLLTADELIRKYQVDQI